MVEMSRLKPVLNKCVGAFRHAGQKIKDCCSSVLVLLACVHSPPCVESTKHVLKDLEDQVKRFKVHLEDIKEVIVKRCPVAGCKERKTPRTQEDLLIHLVNKHSPGPVPPVVPNDLCWQCPRCGVFLVSDNSIRSHIDAGASASECPTTTFRKIKDLIRSQRGVLGGGAVR